MLYRRQGNTRYVALYQGTIEVQKRSEKLTRVLVLTAATEQGDDLSILEDALERQRVLLKQVAREAHIEFSRARMALARALSESAELPSLGPTVL